MNDFFPTLTSIHNENNYKMKPTWRSTHDRHMSCAIWRWLEYGNKCKRGKWWCFHCIWELMWGLLIPVNSCCFDTNFVWTSMIYMVTKVIFFVNLYVKPAFVLTQPSNSTFWHSLILGNSLHIRGTIYTLQMQGG